MARGQLRIYLGAAPGVGKTFAMLNEGNRRAGRGTDVVVGFVETHGRHHTHEQIGELEIVPPVAITDGGRSFAEMDLDAILARRPQVVLVDEFAHSNPPGRRHAKRWQDVHAILDAGIEVISTLNVQHLESVNDVVERITGVRQHETVPDEIVRAADQIELVDMSAEALRRRMAHGNVYRPEEIDAALANYFRPGNLDALRELALLWVADRVDDALDDYRRQHGIDRTWETRERVLVALTGAPSGEQLIRRAARIAQRAHGELLGVHVRSTDTRRDAPAEQLESHRQLLEALGGTYHELVADDLVAALTDFARRENATQLILGASQRSRWSELTRGSVVTAVVRASGTVDVHVISHEQPDGEPPGQRRHRRRNPRPPHGLKPRRRAAGWAVAAIGPLALTVLLAHTRSVFDQGSQFILYLLAVLAAAMIGGAAPALLAAILGALLLNWYFTQPLHGFAVADPDHVVALVAFSVVGVAFGLFVTAFTRRTTAVQRANLEAEALARIAAGLVGADDPVPSMLERIRSTLALDGIELCQFDDSRQIATAGDVDSTRSDVSIKVGRAVLVVYGTVHGEDRHLLEVFGTQLASALDRRRLEREAAAAASLAETDALRTAILRAVSHDLRTPLASIKASVTSLLQADVDWSPQDRHEFLAAIDHGADRLNHVIGDLLDASRLEAGAITPDLRPTALEDVVATTLAEFDTPDQSVHADVDPTLPLVRADPGLLGRAVSNIVANALAHSPPRHPPAVTAQTSNGHVELHVVDHGPGIPTALLDLVVQPFQRLGDTDHRPGVGLGLHIAKGFVDAMHGTIALEETAGGGLTVVIRLPAADDHA